MARLVQHAIEGVDIFTDLLSQPKETTSKVTVYSLCVGIVTCINAVLAYLTHQSAHHAVPKEVTRMLVKLGNFMNQTNPGDFHPQILYEVFGPQPLRINRLGSLLPEQVRSMAIRHPYLEGTRANLYSLVSTATNHRVVATHPALSHSLGRGPE